MPNAGYAGPETCLTEYYHLFGERVYCAVWHDCLVDKKKGQRQRVKEMFVSHLVAEVVKKRDGARGITESRYSVLKLTKTTLGKPLLISSINIYPCISFSYAGSDLWGAISEHEWLCGVDAALICDFDQRFPVHRVFSQSELEAGAIIENNKSSLMALLWSAKESVVKAAGCGFHLISPLDIKLSLLSCIGGLVFLHAELAIAPFFRGYAYPAGVFHIVSFIHKQAWVSVALCENSMQKVGLKS